MAFQWDPAKARANRRKHGVGFPDAVGAFEDPLAWTSEDPYPIEDRFVTVGLDFLGRLVLVSWTWRGDDIRLISARLATPRERRQYEEG
ncbi:MAG: BrnT family toxin [Gemmatimonadales bacterium]|nr:BrnT family toxin [Gemmatimonadales bacterium]